MKLMKPFNFRHFICVSVCLLLSACLTMKAEAQQAEPMHEGWKNLINGNTLDGWVQRGGEAAYRVEDGVIIGTSNPETDHNTFLCTEKTYGDFILELGFKVHPELNSGIQIRSNSLPEYRDGRVHGYQVEIDPSDRAWSAGIYDEARRGWLNNLEDNHPARKAFKQNEWNHVLTVAVGDTIKTWLNGVPAANLKDSMTDRGFIALQVHSAKEKGPMEVRWRNIRILTLDQPGIEVKIGPEKK